MLAVISATAQEDSTFTVDTLIEKTLADDALADTVDAKKDNSAIKRVISTVPDLFDEPKYIDIQYQSKNAKNENVMLSARVYIPEPWTLPDSWIKIGHVILNCHPTVTSNFESPTGSGAIDRDIKRMCGVHDDVLYGWYIIVCPDYCGYGASSYLQHPYLIHDITATNCIDAVLAAINNSEIKKSLEINWDLDIVGYSQGGATALACTKLIQTSGRYSELNNRLRQTVCGDGPYSTVATVKKYIEWGIPAEYDGQDKDLEYPCVLPLIVQAAKEAYGDGCMKTVNTKDFFSQEFINTGIIDMLTNKVTNTTDLNNEIRKKMSRQRPVDLFSDKIIYPNGTFKTESNEYKCLMRALEKGDLTKGWTPQKPLTFYHLPNDGVVPYANFEAAKEGFGNDNDNVRYVEAYQAHINLDEHYKLLFFDAAVGFSNLFNPVYELVNHAEGGTLFYIDYMFGSELRKE